MARDLDIRVVFGKSSPKTFKVHKKLTVNGDFKNLEYFIEKCLPGYKSFSSQVTKVTLNDMGLDAQFAGKELELKNNGGDWLKLDSGKEGTVSVFFYDYRYVTFTRRNKDGKILSVKLWVPCAGGKPLELTLFELYGLAESQGVKKDDIKELIDKADRYRTCVNNGTKALEWKEFDRSKPFELEKDGCPIVQLATENWVSSLDRRRT